MLNLKARQFGMMKSVMTLLLALAMIGGAAVTANAACVVTTDGSGVACETLWAGQNIDAGAVCLKVENNTLKVTFTTKDGWELTEAHLLIGNVLTDLPQNKAGNPVPGQFPFKSGDITGLTEYVFAIPLSNQYVNFSCPSSNILYYMAAHAALRKANGDGTYQTETGWSEGSPITTKGSWATFSTFSLTCTCDQGGSDPQCETAFAHREDPAGRCFLEDGFDRWGWTNGSLGVGIYSFDLYAGAGQCDTSKGTLVGTVTVDYNGSTATVTYDTIAGWWMEETHLYVGKDPYPVQKQGKNFVPTVAPGQYPYKHTDLEGATSDVYSVTISGPIYVIAHAVTCQFK